RWNFQGTKTLLGEIENIFEEYREAEGKSKGVKTLLVPSIVSKGKKETERILTLRKKYEVSKTVVWKLSAIEAATETGKALKENTKGYELFEELTNEVLRNLKGGKR
ncbi:ParA family protein, partial [Leptospira weilii]|nr:ParA family protein [Leptospira weilii]